MTFEEKKFELFNFTSRTNNICEAKGQRKKLHKKSLRQHNKKSSSGFKPKRRGYEVTENKKKAESQAFTHINLN